MKKPISCCWLLINGGEILWAVRGTRLCRRQTLMHWLQGLLFKNAYSAVPSCIPARASLITGQSQNRTGIYGMGLGQKPMRDDYEHTLPGDLAQAGYHTQGIGKMHFHPQRALNGFHNTILDESGRVADPGFVSDYRSWFEENKPKGAGYRDHGLDWNCSWLARPTHLPEWLHPTH